MIIMQYAEYNSLSSPIFQVFENDNHAASACSSNDKFFNKLYSIAFVLLLGAGLRNALIMNDWSHCIYK